jgi:membrane dipeptidase
MRRRDFILGGLSSPLALSRHARAQSPPGAAYKAVQPPIYLSDMHFHSFFGDSKFHSRPVANTLAEGQATLISWSMSGDALWFSARDRYRQHSVPRPAEVRGWVERELARIKGHVSEQKLKLALKPADVDAALKGDPHVVLAIEGAYFIENPADVKFAYDAGVRHLQLMHFIRGPLGDFQTQPPEHNRLTELGQRVVGECNRLGILIDLAHSAPTTVQGALAASQVPMIWSHGSVTSGSPPHPGMITWRARQLTLDQARGIARTGGVVGLWALSQDVGPTVEGYGGRLLQLADWLGDQHVAFGTDMNGLDRNATVTTYADVRRIVEHWQRQRVPESRVRRVASENYARVLKQAMMARRA